MAFIVPCYVFAMATAPPTLPDPPPELSPPAASNNHVATRNTWCNFFKYFVNCFFLKPEEEEEPGSAPAPDTTSDADSDEELPLVSLYTPVAVGSSLF